MGTFSIWHWLVVLAIVVILFGGSGKISRLMGDFAKGINAFRKGLDEGKASVEANSDASSAPVQKIQGSEANSEPGPAKDKSHSTGM